MGSGPSHVEQAFLIPLWDGKFDEVLKVMHPELRKQIDPIVFAAKLEHMKKILGKCLGPDGVNFDKGVELTSAGTITKESKKLKFEHGSVLISLKWLDTQLLGFNFEFPGFGHPATLISGLDHKPFIQRGLELWQRYFSDQSIWELMMPELQAALGCGEAGFRKIQHRDVNNPAFGPIVGDVKSAIECIHSELVTAPNGLKELQLRFHVARQYATTIVTTKFIFVAFRGDVSALDSTAGIEQERPPTIDELKQKTKRAMINLCAAHVDAVVPFMVYDLSRQIHAPAIANFMQCLARKCGSPFPFESSAIEKSFESLSDTTEVTKITTRIFRSTLKLAGGTISYEIKWQCGGMSGLTFVSDPQLQERDVVMPSAPTQYYLQLSQEFFRDIASGNWKDAMSKMHPKLQEAISEELKMKMFETYAQHGGAQFEASLVIPGDSIALLNDQFELPLTLTFAANGKRVSATIRWIYQGLSCRIVAFHVSEHPMPPPQ